jgi:hypothetical protein
MRSTLLLITLFISPFALAAGPAATPATPQEKAQALCKYIRSCNKAHPGKQAYCVKTGLKESKFLNHVLEGDQAKDLSRFLRREGYTEREMGLKEFKNLPDGAILVLDAHDPVKDKLPFCPKVYGNVLVKCDEKWIDDQTFALDFHMKHGCRSKGIWVHPDLVVSEKPEMVRKSITAPDAPPAGD